MYIARKRCIPLHYKNDSSIFLKKQYKKSYIEKVLINTSVFIQNHCSAAMQNIKMNLFRYAYEGHPPGKWREILNKAFIKHYWIYANTPMLIMLIMLVIFKILKLIC